MAALASGRRANVKYYAPTERISSCPIEIQYWAGVGAHCQTRAVPVAQKFAARNVVSLRKGCSGYHQSDQRSEIFHCGLLLERSDYRSSLSGDSTGFSKHPTFGKEGRCVLFFSRPFKLNFETYRPDAWRSILRKASDGAVCLVVLMYGLLQPGVP